MLGTNGERLVKIEMGKMDNLRQIIKNEQRKNKPSFNYQYVLNRLPFRFAASIIFISFFLLLETLFIKSLMLKQARSYGGFFDAIRVSAKEATLFLMITFLLIFLSYVFKQTSFRGISIVYALIGFVYSLSLVAQVVLFKTTGFGLNREYLHNFFQNPGEDIKMVMSEIRWYYLIGTFGFLLFLLWLARLPEARWLNKLRRKVENRNATGNKKGVLSLILFFLIFLEAMALVPRLENVHPAIKQVPFFELIKSFIPQEAEELEAIKILPEERQDKPIIVEPSESFKPLNIVLIIFESLSWKYCDVYKPGLGATPFLAELAKKSLVVGRLYTIDPHTTKALIPIISGIYPYPEPAVLEAKPGILPEKALPHLLRKAGYRTSFFQTANNYEERPSVVANLGYDTFCGIYSMPQEGFAYVNYFGREEMMMLKPSLDWVEENKNQPFFLTYLTLSTHHEYGFPPDFPAKDFGVNNESQNRYLNAVRYTDYFIKKVFEEFKKRNLLDKTIFIILGDHGEAFGEHGLSGHNYSLWEEGLRVPGIIYAPTLLPEPRRIEGFRSILDIAPTVCDLIGLKVVEGEFQGRSLLSPPDEERELFYTGWSKSRVLGFRKGRYKFIFLLWNLAAEIYDNVRDPDDEKNLFPLDSIKASESEHYRKRVEKFFKAVAAQYRQWEKKAKNESKSFKPEAFSSKLEASFGRLINVYGYGYFPEKTEPGRIFYVRVGLKCEDRIRKPISVKVVLKSEQGNKKYSQILQPRVPLENLNPGEYTSAETIIVVPNDWPLGMSMLYFGLEDEKWATFIKPEGRDLIQDEEGLIYIGSVKIFSADDYK